MTNEIFRVDTKKVAKQAGGLGELLMMKCQSGNLLITGQFVLSLSEDQFFSVRCKLEVPQLGTWYMQSKEGLVRSERNPGLEEWETRYNEWVNEADSRRLLTYTRIEISGCYLYTDGFSYAAIKRERLDMLQSTECIARAGKMLVVDGVHVLAPIKEDVWRNNDWLHRLPGMDIEREADEEK